VSWSPLFNRVTLPGAIQSDNRYIVFNPVQYFIVAHCRVSGLASGWFRRRLIYRRSVCCVAITITDVLDKVIRLTEWTPPRTPINRGILEFLATELETAN
jgi:hypothetical protein